ncbi:MULTISPECIES: FHA domain-containing protein [unclassified Coleofasciculus]|uniref:FHA domain-containing protein n=1 Tax=unclassified Coleofasciculus TaxID=2692782 RepID=UPI001882CA8F|nr:MULTISPECIES: FHA domain-containing protein [unclassified Coleofasciculus]MBE9127783.1 FHA domain-containing protein [Coleofasciculus sp. LEGE 07081]MBE9148582.1 FHA domain-containing protein [Coleofasciculus sp. LEGE 07092]
MSGNASPLIQTLNPERWVGLSMDFIGAGCAGLLVKNGQLVRKLKPGRHFSFAVPFFEKCELVLVDTKIRNLEIISQGDFLSRDQYLLNISLNVMYQVVDAKRVALELSEPIAALTSAVKDSLGVAVGQLSVEQLLNQGRVQVRQYLLNHAEVSYALGFALEDVRVGDISFPQTRGIIRQVEGMSARQEAEQQAALKMQIAEAGRPVIPPPPVQQVNIVSSSKPNANTPAFGATLDANAIAGELPTQVELPGKKKPLLAPTIIADNTGETVARLIHRLSGAIFILSATPCTIGREPSNTLVLDDGLSSRHHARIVRQTDLQGNRRYQVIDVGSSNGTFVNGERLAPNQPCWLNSGDVIRVGIQEWMLEQE